MGCAARGLLGNRLGQGDEVLKVELNGNTAREILVRHIGMERGLEGCFDFRVRCFAAPVTASGESVVLECWLQRVELEITPVQEPGKPQTKLRLVK